MNKSRSFVGFARILFIQNKIQLTNAESNVYVNSMRNHKAYLSLIPTLTELWRVRMTTPFPTQLFHKFNNEKRGRFFTKIVKNLPQNGGWKVHFSSLGRKMALASIYFTPWKRHEKNQKPWRLLGFCDRHLFRSLNVVAGVGFFIALPKT